MGRVAPAEILKPQRRPVRLWNDSAGIAGSPSDGTSVQVLRFQTSAAAAARPDPGMERTMTLTFLKTTLIDRRAKASSALPDDDLTAIEIQRWEDDGGAVLPDALSPRKRLVFHPASAARLHCTAPAELATVE